MLPSGVAAPRRVLLTLDAVGGVWRYALDLAAALSARGTECLLVGYGAPPKQEQRAELPKHGGCALVWSSAPLDWQAKEEAELRPARDHLRDIIRDWRPDVLHLNLASQAADLDRDIPVVVASHSCIPTWWHTVRGGRLPMEWAWHRRRNRTGFAQADILIAPSASHASALRAIYGPLPHLAVVHNAVRPPTRPCVAREHFILSVGRWLDDAKNGRVLDAAASLSPWPVRLAGATQTSHDGGIELRNAESLGPLPASAVQALMQRASIFAAPSVYEPFGLAVLEAAHAGAALVLADIPTFRELWDGAALFVQPDDPAAWAAAFGALANNAPRMERLALQARKRARFFTVKRQTDGMFAAYAAAMSRHASRARAAA